jgi:uncharacterized protein
MLVYLHGFASGPGSSKARYFAARVRERGGGLVVPDLAPDFTHMTITSMLAIVDGALAGSGPAALFGSSLGGYLAALAAARDPRRVRGLVLFAPAFGFVRRWEERIGSDAVARWRRNGVAPVQHYGRERTEMLSIALLDDGRRWPEEPDPDVATLVFAGRRDDAVPLAAVERFVGARPDRRELVVFDSGHELTDVLDPMWDRTAAFLERLGAL